MVNERLVRLIEESVRATENEADRIRAGKAKWKHPMFRTVRVLKADSETMDMNECEAAILTGECLSQAGMDFTIYEGIEDQDQGREEFKAQWLVCLYGEGEGPLDLALKRARERPTAFQTACTCELYVPFLNLCDQLQRINAENPIALPVHKVGKKLGVSGATVGAYIKQAVQERYLVPVGKHFYNANGGGKARTFQFYVNRNPTVTELMRDIPNRPRTVPSGALDDD